MWCPHVTCMHDMHTAHRSYRLSATVNNSDCSNFLFFYCYSGKFSEPYHLEERLLGPFEIVFGSLWNHFGFDLVSFGDRFGIIVGSLWDHFWIILGSFWNHFGINLGSIRDHFGINLGSFWIHFEVILGSSGNHLGQILTGILVKPGNREIHTNRVRVRLTGSGYYPLPSSRRDTSNSKEIDI